MKFLIETYMNYDEDFLNTMDDHGSTILDLSIKLRQSELSITRENTPKWFVCQLNELQMDIYNNM